MTEKEFLIDFRSFATNVAHIGKSSAYCYVTYLHNACKLPQMANHLNLIATEKSPSIQIKYAEELCTAVDLAYDDPTSPLPIKDLNNSHTAVHMLLAFVSGQRWIKHLGITVTFTQIFNKKSLIATFKSRLRSQDRIYNFGAYPTNLLTKLATKHKLRLYWEPLILKTKFIYNSSGDSFSFKDVDCVMLGDDDHAYMNVGGKTYSIFTRITKSGIYTELKTKKLRSLSLDHDKPIENELKAALVSGIMPEFEKLGADVLKFAGIYKKANPGADNQKIISEYEKTYDPISLRIDENALLAESQKFMDMLEMTIMDASQNSAKGKRTSP